MTIDLRTKLTPAPNVKVMINIGAGFDIPTGHYIKGRRNESILNGGLAPLTGITGIGNNFKSTTEHYMMLTAMSRMLHSAAKTYDTEVNIHEWHYREFVARTEAFHGEDVLESQRWSITDKTVYVGDEWYKNHKNELEEKSKRKDIIVNTPFFNRERTGAFTMLIPTFTEIDSFTEFETSDVIEMQDKNDLGESGGNTIHMRQGLAKLRILMEAPRLHGQAYDYLLMTAHLGKESTMQNAGPAGSVPIQKLKHLKNGDKIKGTTDKFTFITHNCWHCYNSAPLLDGNRAPEYPRNQDDTLKLDTDLNTVQLRNLRSKSGASGMAFTLIVSQSEGVLPSLTEFHHIKEQGRYGLEGNNINYSLVLYPDCKLQRTTVRRKIDNDPLLRRALNITSEMCQMSYLWHTMAPELKLTPKQLYDSLKALGFDWNVLLTTRGWWTHELGEAHELPFLSTMDLLRMTLPKEHPDHYFPYWMGEDKRPLPQYQELIQRIAERDGLLHAMAA
jgi:hypothetical protein